MLNVHYKLIFIGLTSILPKDLFDQKCSYKSECSEAAPDASAHLIANPHGFACQQHSIGTIL